MAAIMIGSTGNGKSALGNFLLNPDEDHLYGDRQYFKRASDNIPCTQDTKVATDIVRYQQKSTSATPCTQDSKNVVPAAVSVSIEERKQLTLIDTPGLNESGKKDLDHMIKIVDTLEKIRDIHACFIVVKFDTKIDTQYKETVKYYSDLLPALFQRNLVIIMTAFDCSKKAHRIRVRNGIDVEKIEQNTRKEITRICGFSSKPMLLKIDSLPDEDDLEDNLDVRNAILSYIYSCDPVTMTEFKIKKPKFLQELDEKSRIKLETEIKAEESKSSDSDKVVEIVLRSIGELEEKVREINAKISNVQNDRDYKNTANFVDVQSWCATENAERRTRWYCDFVVASEYPLRNVKKHKSGDCEWEREEEKSYEFRCRIQSGANRSFYASVAYQTYMRDRYANEIRYLNNTLDSYETAISSLRREIKMEREKHSQYEVQIEKQKKFIEERAEKINKLSIDCLTIKEAGERLDEIKTRNDVD